MSLLWLIFRTGTKPSRIVYPCQQAALANSSILLGVSLPVLLTSGLVKTKKFLSKKGPILVLITVVAGVLISNEQFLGIIKSTEAANSNQDIYITLQPREAVSYPASNIYVVNGRSYAHINELVGLMGSNGLLFYQSDISGVNYGPRGLIAQDDLIIIKTNSQWDARGGTNTDLLKELIQMIVDHPDGFLGEIVVADNGQAQFGSAGHGGSLDWGSNNAEDHSQSVQDVVDIYSGSYNVSAYLWDIITLRRVNEYSEGDFDDGYVINQTNNPNTGIQVSYPKFRTEFGSYVSFKHGIWNPTMETYESEKLKVINFPVLKTHFVYGVTGPVKHYMGVVSARQTNAHSRVGAGGMGTEMIETRFPTLNIVDAIWVNAHPAPSSYCGPSAPYAAATRVNVVMASTDPVALAYWGSKNVLMQTASLIGYSDTHTINPDSTDRSGVSGEAFGRWLELAKNEIVTGSHSVTTDESQMNVYLLSEAPPPTIDIPSQEPSKNNVIANQAVKVSVNVTDTESGVKNVTLSYSIDSGTKWQDLTMNYNSQTSLYEATIPGQPIETLVNFRIIAYNNDGKSAIKEGNEPYYIYEVIPEFPSWIILPSFLVATIAAVLFRTKIKKH